MDFFENKLLGKSEMNFSAVLAWLLRSDGDHGFGDAFFRKFMHLCELSEQINGKCTVETERELENVFWQTACAPGKGDSRADIFLENDTVVVIIEVKVDARESGNQLCRYKEWLEHMRDGKQSKLVYLTKSGENAEYADTSLAWRDVGRVFLNVLNSHDNDRRGTSISAEIIHQFCHKLLTF